MISRFCVFGEKIGIVDLGSEIMGLNYVVSWIYKFK